MPETKGLPQGAKLLCSGTELEVTKWLVDNRPEWFTKFGFHCAVIETAKGELQRGIWYSAEEMAEALSGEVVHA